MSLGTTGVQRDTEGMRQGCLLNAEIHRVCWEWERRAAQSVRTDMQSDAESQQPLPCRVRPTPRAAGHCETPAGRAGERLAPSGRRRPEAEQRGLGVWSAGISWWFLPAFGFCPNRGSGRPSCQLAAARSSPTSPAARELPERPADTSCPAPSGAALRCEPGGPLPDPAARRAAHGLPPLSRAGTPGGPGANAAAASGTGMGPADEVAAAPVRLTGRTAPRPLPAQGGQRRGARLRSPFPAGTLRTRRLPAPLRFSRPQRGIPGRRLPPSVPGRGPGHGAGSSRGWRAPSAAGAPGPAPPRGPEAGAGGERSSRPGSPPAVPQAAHRPSSAAR